MEMEPIAWFDLNIISLSFPQSMWLDNFGYTPPLVHCLGSATDGPKKEVFDQFDFFLTRNSSHWPYVTN